MRTCSLHGHCRQLAFQHLAFSLRAAQLALKRLTLPLLSCMLALGMLQAHAEADHLHGQAREPCWQPCWQCYRKPQLLQELGWCPTASAHAKVRHGHHGQHLRMILTGGFEHCQGSDGATLLACACACSSCSLRASAWRCSRACRCSASWLACRTGPTFATVRYCTDQGGLLASNKTSCRQY